MNSWIYPRNPTASPSGLFCYSSVAAVSLCYSPSGRRRRRFKQCCPNFCDKRSVIPIKIFWGPRTFSLLAPTIPESFTPIGPRICESIAKMPQETHPLMYLTAPPWITLCQLLSKSVYKVNFLWDKRIVLYKRFLL